MLSKNAMASSSTTKDFDLLFVGGGLSSVLTAYFIKQVTPWVKVGIIESRKDRIHQTWSFHRQDVSEEAWSLLQPFLSKTWKQYDVRFPTHRRTLPLEYASIRSVDFWEQVPNILPDVGWLNEKASDVTKDVVTFASGKNASASVVFDGRGFSTKNAETHCGWQKFVGYEIETDEPHGIEFPTIMDALIEQSDGFRFFYVLPFTNHRLLVEDTYYSDTDAMDSNLVKSEIDSYIKKLGINSYQIKSTEYGCLPIPLETTYLKTRSPVSQLGTAGGHFHPITGYSLPQVVACASYLAKVMQNLDRAQLKLCSDLLTTTVNTYQHQLHKSAKFLIRLNRMLFRACQPEHRWKIFAQFYQRKLSVISNFYNGKLTFKTAVTLVTGIPPVPLLQGIRHFVFDAKNSRRNPEAAET